MRCADPVGVMNLDSGVVHRILIGSRDVEEELWRSHCEWRFARRRHRRVSFDVEVGPRCERCFPELRGT
eukprot:7422114-Heterocapsa_arctica.AAC.1